MDKLRNFEDQIIENSVNDKQSTLFSPNIVLEGHRSHIYSCRFNPNGKILASAGHDRDIFLWDCTDKCKNISLFRGHKNAVLQLCWHRNGDILLTASTDLTAAVWDVNMETRIKQVREHKSYVNSVDISRRGQSLMVTGSDDGSSKIFDLRQRSSLATFDCTYQVTACCFSDDSLTVYTGGIDNDIKIWDIRQRKQISKLEGHNGTITHLSLSPDGYNLLSNSMDMQINCWDVRPYVNDERNRLIKTFTGSTHSQEQLLLRCNWSSDGKRICAGSANQQAYIWDFYSCRILYRLPGHKGSVNEVDFHPTEPIVLSGGSDNILFIGEFC